MTLDIVLITIGIILLFVGIAGCIVPALPGLPLNYIAIILLQLTSRVDFSNDFLIGWGLVVIIVQLLDYYIPIWGTKKLGGGKYGVWGSGIGIVVGMFVYPPFGIILCPFIGAVIGELIDGKEFNIALKAGFGSFIGFIAGTIMKLVVALILSYYFFKEFFLAYILN